MAKRSLDSFRALYKIILFVTNRNLPSGIFLMDLDPKKNID